MNGQDIWIFGYGSLVWQPGFEYAQQEIGRLQNYKRSFCMWSIHYRGTPKNKGLVLALDKVQGAVCEGLLFRVRAKNVDKVLAYLRKRELISEAYLEVIIDVELVSGERYYTSAIDDGAGVPLLDGNFANPISAEEVTEGVTSTAIQHFYRNR